MRLDIQLTGHERFFHEDDIIVSKTDPRGRITYANDVFLEIAGFEEAELLGQAHSIIRHPDMPRAIFKTLWDEIQSGREIFAYVVNRCKNGDHYWVFAHVTPTFDESGATIGYHSNRRVPERSSVERVREIYAELVAEERRHEDWRSGMEASLGLLGDRLKTAGCGYEEMVFSL